MTHLWRIILAQLFYVWGGTHRYFGNKNLVRHDHVAAIRWFTRAYALNPALREALLDRGILYLREFGKAEEALADFNLLLQEDPNYPAARFNRALALDALGEYRRALADLECYLKLPVDEPVYRQYAQRMIGSLQAIVAERK